MPKANLLIINYCILEMKVDNEPAISVPVCSKSVKKWKYVLYKNKTKQKDQKKGGGGGKFPTAGVESQTSKV